MLNRRVFNQLLGMSLIPLTGSISIAKEKKKEKSVLFIWLDGGISQIEFINPIPNAPVEYRSVRGHVKMKNGYSLGGDFTKLASIGDKLTVVRSLKHRDNNHATAASWVMTGEQNFSGNNPWPSYGSVYQYKYGTNDKNTGIPLYVKTSNIESDDAAFLSGKYKGFDADPNGIDDLKIDVPLKRFQTRTEILDYIDKQEGGIYDEWKALKEQAKDIVLGTASTAFNTALEPDEVKNKFNKTKFGQDALLAIRLIQNGVKFVTLRNGGWDMHNQINNGFAVKGPELDNYLWLIHDELQKRDLLEQTLVVVTSEFSRTAKVNGSGGRDHQSSTNSLLFYGGNYNHGNVIGKTSSTGGVVEENEFSPKDLSVTVFNHLDIKERMRIIDNQNRPRELYDENAKNILTEV